MSTPKPPHPRERRVIFKNIDRPGWTNDIGAYLADGGYAELKKGLAMNRADIINEVKTSQLRGRGGAGFGCGMKWKRASKNIATASGERRNRN